MVFKHMMWNTCTTKDTQKELKKKKKQTHEHMYLLIGDLSGHGSTCPESQRDKRLWP